VKNAWLGWTVATVKGTTKRIFGRGLLADPGGPRLAEEALQQMGKASDEEAQQKTKGFEEPNEN